MQPIIGYYHRLRRYFVVNVLYVLVIKIISIDLGKPDGLGSAMGRKIVTNFKSPSYNYAEMVSFDPDLPKAVEIEPKHYSQHLKESENNGVVIKPVRHKKPIPKTIKCPSCNAPYNYIYSNAVVKLRNRKRAVQRYKCKICNRQWVKFNLRRSAHYFCPWCMSALMLKITREEFDKYICLNPDCCYLKEQKTPYIFRDYFFDVTKLELASPESALINLSNIRYSPSLLGLALTLHVNYHIPYRRTADLLNELFGVDISYSTIYNWCESAAYLLAPLVTRLPISTSNLLVADETYERYAGFWGYYYACLDAKNRYLLAPHFSVRRNVEAACCCIVGALRRIKDPAPVMYLVHDHHPAYFLAVQLINQSNLFKFKLRSLPVKGLKDEPGTLANPYRRYKNVIERYFGTEKPFYYLTRGFGSIKGAISHSILQGIDYNYFHPHELYDLKPPIPIPGLRSNNPIEKWNRLISMAAKLSKN